MYVLFKQQPRAEVVDTVLIAVSKSRGLLEEILLSLYEELLQQNMHDVEKLGKTLVFDKNAIPTENTVIFEDIKSWCKERVSLYDIIYVPELED